MAMIMAFEKHGFLLAKTEEELYEIVDAALSVAAWRNPEEFQNRRDQIAKTLFSLPEDVIGFRYQKSHCTMESTTGSGFTKDSVPKDLNTNSANSPKKSPKKGKLKKPYIPTATNSKKDEKKKKVDVKFVVSKTDEGKKHVDDQNLGVSTMKSESVASNVKKNVRNNDALIDKKFEFSKRKLERRYKQLGERARKTQVLDFAGGKDLIKPTRDVKRPRFRS